MKDMMGVVDVAKELNISVETLYNWAKAGRIQIVEESPKRRFVSVEQVNKLRGEVKPKGVKTCTECGFTGTVDQFAPKRLKCHACYAKYQADKRLRNIDSLREYDKNRYTGERKEKQKETAREYYYNNQEKVKEQVNKRYPEIKEYIKYKSIKNTYGLTEDQYKDMLEKANYQCEICKGVTSKMCVDHNHTNGEIRGILCHTCNSAIGFFKESLTLLEAAVEYLKKHESDKTET